MIKMNGFRESGSRMAGQAAVFRTWGSRPNWFPRQNSEDFFAFLGYGQDFSSDEAEEVFVAVPEFLSSDPGYSRLKRRCFRS